MGKFVIECPSCGNYTEASNFIFAKKTIACSCGNIINVKTDKMSSKSCPHCGNMVIYDQSKGEKAKCPVCHNPVNTRDGMHNLIQFSCPTCSCSLSAEKSAVKYTCPLCDTEVDVQEQYKKEEIKKKGLASVIKYEGPNNVFVWKHPIEDFNMGSQLIVHESQEAIFFQDGKALDLFGSGRYTLSTQNLPILDKLYELPLEGSVFHSEVYFINMTTQMDIKWGTDSKVRLFDPSSGLHIELGACGSFNMRVNNSRKLLLKVVGTESELAQGSAIGGGGIDDKTMTGKFRALIMNKVKSNLARAIKELQINILEIDSYLDELSDRLKNVLNDILDDYGLVMPEFYITAVLTPDDDPNFKRLKQQFADRTLKVREEEIRKAEAEAAQSRKMLEAQTAAQLKIVGAQGDAEALKLKAQAEAEAYKMQAFAEAEEMRAKGYTYQQETARQVGLEAMQNGLVGNGSGITGSVSSTIGDVAGLGVSLGAMGSVIGMTKEAMSPIMETTTNLGRSIPTANGWDCKCGKTNITSKFCPECGSPKPEPVQSAAWNCSCGLTGITSKFCPECGSPKPEVSKPVSWTCPKCGQTEITSKFCPECGTPKGE
jgi:membrane protease subunit (stomatin/prohibitin family)